MLTFRSKAIGALAALFAGVACGSNGSSTGNSSQPILIGMTGPLSGNYAAPGIDMLNAARVTANMLNNQGGVLGRKIQIVSADDQCDAQVGVQAAEKLVSQHVVAVAGGYCSGATIPETTITHRQKLPFIAIGASNPMLTEQGFHEVFRVMLRDDQEGPQDASWLMDNLKLKRIAIMHDNSTYAKALAQFAQTAVERKGGAVTYFDAITPGQKDYSSAITRVASTNPEALLFTGYYAEAGLLLKEWKDLGLDKKFPFMGGGGIYDPAVLTAAGSAAEGMYVLFPVGPDTAKGPAFDEFKSAYKQQTGKDLATYSIYEYDAIKMLALALKKANSTSPAAVADALHQVSYEGITGPIKFDSKGDREQLIEVAFQVKNGQFTPIAKKQGSDWAKMGG